MREGREVMRMKPASAKLRAAAAARPVAGGGGGHRRRCCMGDERAARSHRQVAEEGDARVGRGCWCFTAKPIEGYPRDSKL
jgi:hypothetical protein